MPVTNKDCQAKTPVASVRAEAIEEKMIVMMTSGSASKGNHCKALPRLRSSSAER